ncbi:MAG: hypothetical protein ACJ77E_00635 [Gaiellaceae bacterium]
MRRHLLDLIVLFVLSSLVCGYVALAQPGLRNVALHVYVFVVGGLLMLGLIAAAGDSVPRRSRSELDQALAERARRDVRIRDVERTEREVTLATASAYDLHYRLLPHLREIAQCRLERAGKAPSPETLGPWWELLRADRPEPEDRFAPGIKQAELRALVDDLERM